MMKAELASQSGFSMPEKYFQVRREEAADGKYYSKIGTSLIVHYILCFLLVPFHSSLSFYSCVDAIDWDELV
jgi:hypothetical protein